MTIVGLGFDRAPRSARLCAVPLGLAVSGIRRRTAAPTSRRPPASASMVREPCSDCCRRSDVVVLSTAHARRRERPSVGDELQAIKRGAL